MEEKTKDQRSLSKIDLWENDVPSRDVLELILGVVPDESAARNYRLSPGDRTTQWRSQEFSNDDSVLPEEWSLTLGRRDYE